MGVLTSGWRCICFIGSGSINPWDFRFRRPLLQPVSPFTKDMGRPSSLQQLITAYACQSIIDQKISHRHIPDSPVVESERRQILFGAAIGIPTFFVQNRRPMFDAVDTERSGTHPAKQALSGIHPHSQ